MRYLTKGLLLTLTLSLALQVVAVGQPIGSGWGVGCKELVWAVPDRHEIFNATSTGMPASQMGPILEPNGIVPTVVAPAPLMRHLRRTARRSLAPAA